MLITLKKPNAYFGLAVSGYANSHVICLQSGNCTWHAKLYHLTYSKQAVLVDTVSQSLTPDVFILQPMFGLQTNRSFKARIIMCDNKSSLLSTRYGKYLHGWGLRTGLQVSDVDPVLVNRQECSKC